MIFFNVNYYYCTIVITPQTLLVSFKMKMMRTHLDERRILENLEKRLFKILCLYITMSNTHVVARKILRKLWKYKDVLLYLRMPYLYEKGWVLWIECVFMLMVELIGSEIFKLEPRLGVFNAFDTRYSIQSSPIAVRFYPNLVQLLFARGYRDFFI